MNPEGRSIVCKSFGIFYMDGGQINGSGFPVFLFFCNFRKEFPVLL